MKQTCATCSNPATCTLRPEFTPAQPVASCCACAAATADHYRRDFWAARLNDGATWDTAVEQPRNLRVTGASVPVPLSYRPPMGERSRITGKQSEF